MAVNWGLGAPVNVGGMFTQGFEHGQQVARERQTDQALAAFTQDPENPQAINALMRVNPRVGFQLYQDQRKSQKETRIRELVGRVTQGDNAAMPELLTEAPELWSKLDKQAQDQAVKATSFMANAGLQIGQLPEAQRAQAWEAYVRQAEAGGLDIPTQYERYSPQAFNAAMAEAGKMGEFLDSQKIDWKSVPFGATFVPTNAGTGQRLDVPQTQGGGGQAAPITREEAAPIISQAQQSGTISSVDAQRFIQSVGEPAFRQWAQKYNVKVEDGGQNRASILAEAQAAIAKGADPAAVQARLRQMGIQ